MTTWPMQSEPILIYKDPRPIHGIYSVYDSDGFSYWVRRQGVTKIVAYRECGDGGWIPWIAVYVGEDILMRVSANACAIEYFTEEKKK